MLLKTGFYLKRDWLKTYGLMPFVIDICCHNKWTNTVYEYHIIDQYFLEKKVKIIINYMICLSLKWWHSQKNSFFQIKILFMFYINWKNKWKSFYRSNGLIQKVRKNFLKNISNDDLFNTRTRETNLKFIILFALKNCLIEVFNEFIILRTIEVFKEILNLMVLNKIY